MRRFESCRPSHAVGLELLVRGEHPPNQKVSGYCRPTLSNRLYPQSEKTEKWSLLSALKAAESGFDDRGAEA
jgi:hypothetical protein